ncbi:MAG: bifunctional oligoribonuclease/PAP phosphatase NrnA [Planctomycetaceae bacterium]|nr:bifunctional oligoribonuclease/PAP phosphatase NrnA [Planctomycetaceae bacterium]
MKIDWEPLREIVSSGQRFVLSSHARPDADALGSELGMALLLESLGKSVRIVNPSASPAHLKFLDPTDRALKIGVDISAEDASDADVHIVLDTGSWVQLPDVSGVLRNTSARKVVIDHHPSWDDLGATVFRDTSAPATGVLVCQLADALGWELTREMALPLFCAIATDTGWFRFSSTDAGTFRDAARLIELGVQPHEVYRQLYEQYSLARVHLAGTVFSRVKLACEGRLGYTWISLKDFQETGASPSDTDELVNQCLTLEGVECAFIAIEQFNKRVKFSLRSRTSVNVSQVAEELGGGGHRQASGAMLPGPLEQAVPRVLQAMAEAIEETPAESAPSEIS